MNFLYPAFLFALFAVFIPVIIHLFNFRTHKTLYFSNVKFLKNIKKETKSKSNLKHLLILLLRILTIASLVFAFTKPFIPLKSQINEVNKNFIGVYIDNSFSTDAESKYGKIIEAEKKKALEIAAAFPEDVKILFLNNNFELKHQHFVSKEQFKDFVLQTKTSPFVKKLSEVSEKMKSIFTEKIGKNMPYTVYFISDFQKTSIDLENMKPDSLQNKVLIPIFAEKTSNIFIDSAWFESPNRPVNQEDMIFVKIKNASDENYAQMPLKLFLNGELKAAGTFSIEANSETTEKITFINEKTGIINGKIEISDYPVIYDNVFYFNFNLTDTTKILIINDNDKNNKYINNIFSELPYAYVKNIPYKERVKHKLNDFNVVICDGLKKTDFEFSEKLIEFTDNGGILLIFPKINCDISSYNKLFNSLNTNYITGLDTTKIYADKINFDSEVLTNVFKKKEKNIDMPYVHKRLIFSDLSNIDEEVILYTEKNDKLINSVISGNGKVFIFSMYPNPEYGNIIFHPIWVPILYNAVFYNTAGKNIFYTIGNNDAISIKCPTNTEDYPLRIISEEKGIDVIPQFSKINGENCRILLNNTIQEAGHYKIMSEKSIVAGISLNYNRKESYLTHYNLDDLRKFSKEHPETGISVTNADKELLKETVLYQSNGINLYKYFLIAALIFLAAEILIIKFMKI